MGDQSGSHDDNKRTTLKMLGGTAIGLSVSSFARAGELFAPGMESDHLPELALPRSNTLEKAELQMELISSDASPGHTLVFRNNTDQTLVVTQFLPSLVYVNARQLNVNDALDRGPLVLTPGRYVSIAVELQTMSDVPAIEYIWADQARETIGEHLNVTRLGAFMSGSRAILFTNPVQDIPA